MEDRETDVCEGGQEVNELISRDKAIEIAEFYATHGWPEDQIGNIAEEIKKIDTVDAKAVRHGRWKAVNPRGSLSQIYVCEGKDGCGALIDAGCYTRGCDYDFCPFCGAKMDGVTE